MKEENIHLIRKMKNVRVLYTKRAAITFDVSFSSLDHERMILANLILTSSSNSD